MSRHLSCVALWASAVALTAGCASEGEREMFAQYTRKIGDATLFQTNNNKVIDDRNRVASPILTDRSGLGEYLTYAALHNPGLEAAFARWKAALERIPQARALPDPQLSYRYFIFPMGSGPDMEQRQGASVSQVFPWLGKLDLKGDVAAKEAQAEFRRFEAARLKLFYDVQQAYYEYYYLFRAVAIADENAQLMKYLEGVARARYKSGVGSHPDVIRAQVELGKLDNEQRSLRDLRGPRAAKLNAALNRPAESPLPWPGKLEPPAIALSDGQLLEYLAESNPELKAMDSEIAARRQEIELAGKDYFPDIMLGAEWMDMTARPGVPMSSQDNWAVMVSLNIPIWWEKYAAGVRQARALHIAGQRDKADKANLLQSDLKMAVYEYRDAWRKISLYRDTLLPKGRESLKATEEAYRAGAAGFSDLVDAQRVLLEFELSCARALADSQQRLAEVEMLVGREIPRSGNAGERSAVEMGEEAPIPMPRDGEPQPATQPAANE